jgi:3-phosphoshikimate 1-carboxyvinyltransferase
MDYLAFPPAGEMRGVVQAPPSKSATNRALVLAALSETPVEVVGPLDSEDTRALARCLAAMGAEIEPSPRGLLLRGLLGRSEDHEATLDAAESGTAARFLAALAAAIPGRFVLTGSPRLRERPVGELVDALESLGASVGYAGEAGRLPLVIRGGSLRAGRVAVDASRSSQFVSALLLAAPAVPGGLEVSASSPVASAPYVATTLTCLKAFGHEVSGTLDGGGSVRVARGAVPARAYAVPGDYSSALPLLAAAGIAGGVVTVTGLEWPSSDADAQALPVLERMGIGIEGRADGVTSRASRGHLEPVFVLASDFPDAVPTLAALASAAAGESRFHGIAQLRLKESDRIGSLVGLLSAAGIRAFEESVGLVVAGGLEPGLTASGKLPTFGDHRIAMAAALLSLSQPGLLIENPECVAKSYPGFFRDLDSLCVRL